MAKDIMQMLDEHTSEQLALDILKKMENIKNDPGKNGLIDYSFDISKGKLKGDQNSPNTQFAFDFDSPSLGKTFTKAMYSRELTNNELEEINRFILSLADKINSNYFYKLQKIIRDSILSDSDPDTIPLEKIKINQIEIVDFDSIDNYGKHSIKILKTNNSQIDMEKLQKFLRMEFEKDPNQEISEISKREIKNCNPIFHGVKEIVWGEKFLWDVNISMFVDYSFSDNLIRLHTSEN